MELKKKVAGAMLALSAVGVAAPQTASALLHPGKTTQHPSSGGTWEYGFWDVKVRSYYTVGSCHGSSVIYNGDKARSADTAKNQKSIAEKYAVNLPGNSDSYYYRTC